MSRDWFALDCVLSHAYGRRPGYVAFREIVGRCRGLARGFRSLAGGDVRLVAFWGLISAPVSVVDFPISETGRAQEPETGLLL
jgi:hypothetical protein